MTQRLTLTLILLALLSASLAFNHPEKPAEARLVMPRTSEMLKNEAFPPPLDAPAANIKPAAFDI